MGAEHGPSSALTISCARIPGLAAVAVVGPEEFDFIPGASMTLQRMVDLSQRVTETLVRRDVDGLPLSVLPTTNSPAPAPRV